MWSRKEPALVIPIEILTPQIRAAYPKIALFCQTKGLRPPRWEFPVREASAEIENNAAVIRAIHEDPNIPADHADNAESFFMSINLLIASLLVMADQGLLLDRRQMKAWAAQILKKASEQGVKNGNR